LKLSQFIHRHDLPVSANQIDRIHEFHFLPLSEINKSVPINHTVCFRHKVHEFEKGRIPVGQETFLDPPKESDGRKFWSAHTFEKNQRDPEGKGACDVSADDMRALVALVEDHINPSRIALYDTFIHYDYCWADGNVKFYDSSWVKIGRTEFYNRL
jgi:hypothetical protein